MTILALMIGKKKNKFESLEGSGCLELHLIMGLLNVYKTDIIGWFL